MFSERRTFIDPVSFHPRSPGPPSRQPPTLPPPVLQAGSCSTRFCTSAIRRTRRSPRPSRARTAPVVGVSLWLTDPPPPSHMCFYLSGLKVTDLFIEPDVICLGNGITIIRVIYNLGVTFAVLSSS
nr:unnamed protein product [Digitaria exilis]